MRHHITYFLSLSLSFVIVWRAKNYLVVMCTSRCAPSYHLLLHWIKPRRRILKLVKSIIEKINSVNPSGNSCTKITIEKAQFWYILSQEHLRKQIILRKTPYYADQENSETLKVSQGAKLRMYKKYLKNKNI